MIIIQAIGNLGRDAEVKSINERQYLSFSVASTEKHNNEEQTTWLSILYPYQEALLPYLKKGQQVFISGKLKAGIYQSQSTFGIDLSVFASTLQLCGGSKREDTVPAGSASSSTPSAPATPPPAPMAMENDPGLPF